MDVLIRWDKVPRKALTLTIPALFSGTNLVCVVPTKYKAVAVKNMLMGEISTECPVVDPSQSQQRHPLS